MADATEKGASKEAPFFIAARKRGFFAPKGRGEFMQPERAAPFLRLEGAGDSIAARQRCILFPALAREGERRARRGTKGGILFSKRIPPLNPPEKDEGRPPSTPDIASLWLEELLSLRNRVRCTWLRHESSASRYVLQSRLTVVRRV